MTIRLMKGKKKRDSSLNFTDLPCVLTGACNSGHSESGSSGFNGRLKEESERWGDERIWSV